MRALYIFLAIISLAGMISCTTNKGIGNADDLHGAPVVAPTTIEQSTHTNSTNSSFSNEQYIWEGWK